jgi:large subunit ribosomal protein L3
MTGHFAKSASTPKRFIREFRLAEGETAPETAALPVSNFEAGQFVDIIGQSKGKGFQGTIKKHNFGGQPASHGSTMHRRNGAIGNRSTPGRVWKNMGMPGHMGDERITGAKSPHPSGSWRRRRPRGSRAIPGANGSFVVVRPSKKKTAKK